ncbi:hypothetical protein [Bacillus salipaludis]|uniref:hypothetical protein n=1 Tax=Bacillus salipaludis TaxID=2547811 RepID=UPI002E1DD9F5|nr:hypothetical protein [Bacillus salipaludis]
MSVLDQLIQPGVLESLTTLVNNLLKLEEMVISITKFYDTAQSIIKNRVLIEDLIGGIQDFINIICWLTLKAEHWKSLNLSFLKLLFHFSAFFFDLVIKIQSSVYPVKM